MTDGLLCWLQGPKLADDEDGVIVLDTRDPGAWVISYLSSPPYLRSKSGEWRYESSPSNRTREYIEDTRYATPEEALVDWIEYKAKIA